VASLGAQLKKAREQRGVGLDEIAQTTKIGTRFLRALEGDHYEQLPGGIFNKGFIRAYARAVGLDEETAIAEYLAATEPSQARNENSSPAPTNRIVELRTEAESPSVGDLPWEAFAIILLLGALALAGWGFYSRERRASKMVGHETSANALNSSAAQPVQLSPNKATGAVSVVPPSAVNTPSGSETHIAAETKAEAATPILKDTAAADYFSVQVNVRQDSWLSISADGKTLLQGKFAAPAQKSVKARNQVIVQTGNTGGVDFEFNGQRLPPQGNAGEVKTLTFGADGLDAVQASTQPAPSQP
jgi:cytoskeleton protein RodZ